MVIPIMLDLDLAMGAPGSDIDDGFALALAVADPDLDLRLVTTVNGNTDVDTATTLTLELLDQLGCADIEVRRGAGRPLLHPQSRFGRLPDGIEPRAAPPGHAAIALTELARTHPGELTLVAIGPLTNIAVAMLLDPQFAGRLAGLTIMGGVFTGTTGRSDMPGEFNVWSDPEAARIVLQSGIVAHWVGLDVTRRVRISRAQAETMAADAHPFTAYAGRFTTAWIDHLAADDPGLNSCPLHDPLAVVTLTQPGLVRFVDAWLDVQLDGPARGALVADLPARREGPPANARVAVDVDPARFADHLDRCLRRL